MPVFAYTIAADQDRPSEGDGYVRAETIRQAVALVGHPDANVYPARYERVAQIQAKGAQKHPAPIWRQAVFHQGAGQDRG